MQFQVAFINVNDNKNRSYYLIIVPARSAENIKRIPFVKTNTLS